MIKLVEGAAFVWFPLSYIKDFPRMLGVAPVAPAFPKSDATKKGKKLSLVESGKIVDIYA